MNLEIENISLPAGAKIKVVGIGGGGGNAVSTMIKSGVEGVDFMALNTDVQALNLGLAPTKLQIGKELTRGLGAGADPDIGRDATLEDRHEIQQLLTGADMVFVTAGMGGGTGTGGASIVAQIARELGALTVGVVTKPFDFEGKRRRKYAEMGIARLRECVDTLITIPNQRLLQLATPDLTMIGAFKLADDVLVNAVKGISDIINIPGTINVDFADVKTVMSGMGLALMGIGSATGEHRAREAAIKAISSPLLEDVDIEGATGILINVSAGSQVTLLEINEACTIIQDAAHEDANIIFGAVIDESLGDEVRVTVIATGFPSEYSEKSVVKEVKTATYFQDSYSQGSSIGVKNTYTSRITKPIISTPNVGTLVGASANTNTSVNNYNNNNNNNNISNNTSSFIQEEPQAQEQVQQAAEEQTLNIQNQAQEFNAANIEENLSTAAVAAQEPQEDLNLDAFSGIVSADDKEFSFMSNEEENSNQGEIIEDQQLLDFNDNIESNNIGESQEIEGADLDSQYGQDQMIASFGEDCDDDCDCSTCEVASTCEYAKPNIGASTEIASVNGEASQSQALMGASVDGTVSFDDTGFNQKIDEAIALAGKLEEHEGESVDNIEVPAYLRGDIEDISLE